MICDYLFTSSDLKNLIDRSPLLCENYYKPFLVKENIYLIELSVTRT